MNQRVRVIPILLAASAAWLSVAASAQEFRVRALGGFGFDSGDKVDCPADSTKPCELKVELTLKRADGTCNVKPLGRPHLEKGQTLKWTIVPATPPGSFDPAFASVDFDPLAGIVISGDPGQRFFGACKPSVGTMSYECTRKKGGGKDDIDQGNRLAYGINIVYTYNGKPRLCLLDPLIISRD